MLAYKSKLQLHPAKYPATTRHVLINRWLASRVASSWTVACKNAPQVPEDKGPTFVQRAAQLVAATTAGLLLTLGPAVGSWPTGVPPAHAESQKVVRLPASSLPEVFSAQQTLIEAWGIIGESFVDAKFNGQDWTQQLLSHMQAAYSAEDPAVARQQIDLLLAGLGDPYTRHITVEDYQGFRESTDGELQGVGLLIANQTSHLVVLSPIKGGPAERAGILPGDEVITINGRQTAGMNEEAAAQLLRGQGGTEVRVKLARRSEQIPGVTGVPEARPDTKVMVKEVKLKRERVNLSPVYYTALRATGNGARDKMGADNAKPDVGYVRLTQFSHNAAEDMRLAITELESQGVGEYILDLRSNPGGLVSAGIDVASLWLDGEKPVFNVQGREGKSIVQMTKNPSPALTHKPLVVLVNEDSASASEILSGALRDNHRAVIVGDTHTYGKGKIQTVYELHDGSALFVTVAKYRTPGGTDIDHKGIRPDSSCHPSSRRTVMRNLAITGPSRQLASEPVPSADSFSPGLPISPAMEAALVTQLQRDSCVLAAEDLMLGKTKGSAMLTTATLRLSGL